ncbi:MAG: hypothetical protein LBE20_04475 [Deltaproteobacteria bacterium]|jgi:hypothetical protein|nr:hypothetical protein [Deltaproteobacteria bacterium]
MNEDNLSPEMQPDENPHFLSLWEEESDDGQEVMAANLCLCACAHGQCTTN